MRTEPENWLMFAREDLQMANLAIQNQIYNQACFHAQQCAEKALKALISHSGNTPPKIHRLVDLVNLLNPNPLDTINLDVQLLDRFYLSTRYPGTVPNSEDLAAFEDAQECIRIATQVLETVSKYMIQQN
ncbi:MAG: HEPN domain-containing protein [Phormidium sp. GEM2.Bin31]|nr:MAG: HEPN domain-containing protein [Phormidium sp. GEM2.Bin31]